MNSLLNETKHQSADISGINWLTHILLPFILVILIVTTVIGNVFVILAIVREKSLKSTSNYLILSLAITDLLVACVVMPIGMIYEIYGEWRLGSLLCDIWLSADVLCCTASILHLLAIAMDRYLTLTNIDYIHRRNKGHVCIMIILVWTVASIISFAPIFGWKDELFEKRLNDDKLCLYSQDIAYQLFATFFSFYGPVVIILILYYKIYKVAKKRIRRKQKKDKRTHITSNDSNYDTKSVQNPEVTVVAVTASSSGHTSDTALLSDGPSNANKVQKANNECKVDVQKEAAANLLIPANISCEVKSLAATNSDKSDESDIQVELSLRVPDMNCNGHKSSTSASMSCLSMKRLCCRTHKRTRRIHRSTVDNHRETVCSVKERRAAKILMIITSFFVACWLPFFVLALIMPLCSTCKVSRILISFCLWLGYVNSMINPILYTFFSPEFRCAFKKLISCCKSKRHLQN